MRNSITAIIALVTVSLFVQYATAESIPDWIKTNAGWWSEGDISESDFILGIQYLIKEKILVVPPTAVSAEKSSGIPDWIKTNAGWWSEGVISDDEFISAIQHLMSIGLISVSTTDHAEEMISEESTNSDSELAVLESELEACSEITKAYKRLDCEKPIKKAIMLYEYKKDAQKFEVGPTNYYWKGIGTEGSEFEISPTGQAILSIRMLAENTSSDIVSLNCTSPQICNYDIWDGSTVFKYSGMDFTNGQININPGDTKEFNMLFGPNIGYGGTQFEYDSSKEYVFRIQEPWGSTNIQLNLE